MNSKSTFRLKKFFLFKTIFAFAFVLAGLFIFSNSDVLAASVGGGDGVYELKVSSCAPTSDSGFTPNQADGFNLGLLGISYRIVSTGSESNDIGAAGSASVPGSSLPSDRAFRFFPALTSAPSVDNPENIQVNTSKDFDLTFKNNSSNRSASGVQFGLQMDAGDGDVVWGSELSNRGDLKANWTYPDILEKIGLIEEKDVLISSGWNAIPKSSTSLSTGEEYDTVFTAMPVLEVGSATPESFETDPRTFLNYQMGHCAAVHKGYPLSEDLGEVAAVTNAGLQIVGLFHSEIGMSEDVEDSDGGEITKWAENVGDFYFAEAKNVTLRNQAAFISDPNSQANACQSLNQYLIDDDTDWENYGCGVFQDGDILYFRNANVILRDSDGDGVLTLPKDSRTIIVEGGDVFIQSNIKMSDTKDSFGIVARKLDPDASNPLSGGGNLRVYPDVTNVVAAVYSEGSVLSVTNSGSFVGFVDRAEELKNQLYWQGLIISRNTVGGAQTDPPACPLYLEEECVRDSAGSEAAMRENARLFDLDYLRTFHPTSGGTRATDPAPPGGASNNYAFIIEYTGNIKNNPPPLFGSQSGASGGSL